MPRSLARLRYRAPRAPVSFPLIDAANPLTAAQLERRVAQYVVRNSSPNLLRLQTVVNPKAKGLATGQWHPAPNKPFTLRDLVDPEGKRRHGEIIYVFRNSNSNQIIYSLQELLDNHHLEQLPFIGKHSKPPVLRPDEWVPHCVVTFPSPEQGHNAFRKLREFRKLHELSWKKTNPEYINMPVKLRMKKIMDQRANTSADLAEVLRIQEAHGADYAEKYETQTELRETFLEKRWEKLEALAEAAAAKEKDADNTEWLKQQIRSLESQMKMKHNQTEANQNRLKAAKESHETRLRRIEYAIRKVGQMQKMQAALVEKSAPANEADAEQRLEELKAQAQVLQEAVDNHDPSQAKTDLAMDQQLLAEHKTEIQRLEEAFEAKRQAETRDHYITRTAIPMALRKDLPIPYSLHGVSVQWADIQDAMYAAGQWPEVIEHEVLAINGRREEVALLSADDFAIETNHEVNAIMRQLQPGNAAYNTPDVYDVPPLEPPKSGVSKYLPSNPFKSARA